MTKPLPDRFTEFVVEGDDGEWVLEEGAPSDVVEIYEKYYRGKKRMYSANTPDSPPQQG